MNTKFGQMSPGEKLFFVGALAAFVLSSGFAFPKLLHDDDYVKKYS